MSGKLPGRTSTISLPSGLMSLQTEAHQETGEIVSILVFQGRVLKRHTDQLPEHANGQQGAIIDAAHASFESEIRLTLERAATARASTCEETSSMETVGQLFLMALEAYAGGDNETCRLILETLVVLAPDDQRIRGALEGLDDD